MPVLHVIPPPIIRERLDYDPDTGVLIWRRYPPAGPQWNGRFAGTEAGTCTVGYALRITLTHEGKQYVAQATRIIWALHRGKWPKNRIYRKDHNDRNNRIENLVELTRSEAAARHHSKTVLKPKPGRGVTYHKHSGKWLARITVDNKVHSLGYFKDKADALAARAAAEEYLRPG